jgi:hypothetical protein
VDSLGDTLHEGGKGRPPLGWFAKPSTIPSGMLKS